VQSNFEKIVRTKPKQVDHQPKRDKLDKRDIRDARAAKRQAAEEET